MTDIVEVLTPPNSFSDTATVIVSAGEMRDAVAEFTSLRAENERLGRDYETARDAHDSVLADNERLRAALRGLLECPHIADRDIDPAWGEPETEKAVEAARAALAAQPAPGGKDE